jgi:hypothetical protein
MIETTLGHLVLAEPALERLGAKLYAPRVGYTLAKLRAAVQVETALFVKMREELAREHGDIRDAQPEERATLGPRVIAIRPDRFEQFTNACTELAGMAVRLDVAPLDLALLGDDPIAANDLLLLGPLLADGVPAPRIELVEGVR